MKSFHAPFHARRSQAVPAELRLQQRYKDLLIENTEKVLLTVNPVRTDAAAEEFNLPAV